MAKLLEQVRLRIHFHRVLGELRSRDVSHLAEPERNMRNRLVLELERYARGGLFPQNLDFEDRRMPYFVDASGTRCAMAHLIDSTGERDLVDRVRATRNNAYVRELAPDRALQAWLRGAGLTVAEAARIQPAYCFETKAQACFCNTVQPSDGVLTVTATDQVMDGVVARIDVLHGNTGTLTVGQSITVDYTAAHPGDAMLVPVRLQPAVDFGYPFRLDGNDVILSGGCDAAHVPTLSKADAIAAVLAQTTSDGCAMKLETFSSEWGESQCDDTPNDDGGCAIAGAGSPLVLGAALAAALWTRRRPLFARR
ncbi:MAG TPA: hypothetical protein VIV11_17035 [Kofleriaceae bacterium]